MTGYQRESVNEQILTHLSQWCEVIRWAGGSAIENYNLKYHFNKTPSSSSGTSTGEWIDYVRSFMPEVDFNIGVPSSLGMSEPLIANIELNGWLQHPEYRDRSLPGLAEYSEELVNYLNLDYSNSWGVNPVRDKPAGVQYIEVENEPNRMFNNHSLISESSDRSELINMAYREAAERLYEVDSDVLIVGPSCMKAFID